MIQPSVFGRGRLGGRLMSTILFVPGGLLYGSIRLDQPLEGYFRTLHPER
jgi:hypothetical protein